MRQLKYFKTAVLQPALLVGLLLVAAGMRGPAALSNRPAVGPDLSGSAARPVWQRAAMEWMNVDEAQQKLRQEQRPVLIDLYTTWCGWCREMDRKTYSNKKVAAYLQDKFYPVKVDAETRAAISWQGRTYAFNPQYKSNEFALYLTHGRLEFPTTIIIPPGGAPQAIPGFMKPKELELLVKYFGDGAYKTLGFDEYQKKFKGTW